MRCLLAKWGAETGSWEVAFLLQQVDPKGLIFVQNRQRWIYKLWGFLSIPKVIR